MSSSPLSLKTILPYQPRSLEKWIEFIRFRFLKMEYCRYSFFINYYMELFKTFPSCIFRETYSFLQQQKMKNPKVIRQGKLFQRCTHLLYCSVLSLSVNTRRMSQPDLGFIFYIKKSMK